MFDKIALQSQIAAALTAKSADPFLTAKRQLGLRFLVDAKPTQSLSDVAAAFRMLDERFQVEHLYPAPDFTHPEPDPELSWRDSAFVARLDGVSFDDISVNPWDLAHAARLSAAFVTVIPDAPGTAPEPPAHRSADAANIPGPGWEPATMRIKEAWDAFKRRNLDFPGSHVIIGHPDTGWTPHACWEKGNLDRANSRNFMPNEDEKNAQDPLTGAQPGHGTATASVMVSPHGFPVVGVAPHAVVIPLRCVSTVILYFGQTELVRAVAYAADKGCRVISISLGGYGLGGHGVFQFVRRDLVAAIKRNIIVVAASGQYLWATDYATVEPASYPEVIGVAGVEGTTTGIKPWGHSCRNPKGTITISAPAYPVYRLKAERGKPSIYENSEGTSYATAFVAGIAALWLSFHFRSGYPSNLRLTAQEAFKEHVQRTAQKPTGWDEWFYGIVDAGKLMDTEPRRDPKSLGDEAPPEIDITSASAVVGMLGGADPGRTRHMMEAAVLGQNVAASAESAANLEAWSAEIQSILVRHPETLAEVSRLMQSAALTPMALDGVLAPYASNALRSQLAEAARV
jgi:hypothetical protein